MSNLQLIIFSIICWGTGNYFYKLSSNYMTPMIMGLIITIFYAIFIPIATFISKTPLTFTWRGVIYAALGAMVMCSGSLAYFTTLKHGAAGEITAATSVYPAITLLLSVLFLGEELSIRKICGCLLALASVFVLTFK